MIIERIECENLIPAAAKGSRVSLTEPKKESLALLRVSVTTQSGESGLAEISLPTRGGAVVESLIKGDLQTLLKGESANDTDRLYTLAVNSFKPLGFAGAVSRAYAAIDFALWDLKAQTAKRSLGELLGNARKQADFFVSDRHGPSFSADEIVEKAKPWLQKGAKGVVFEVGCGEVQKDADRVRDISEQIGEEAWLGVNAQGRYDLGTALALAHFFDDQGVGWFEEPLPFNDRDGYNRLANRMETTLAAGALCQSLRELYELAKAGSVRMLRPDPLRIGGLTPIIKLISVAEACHCTVVPVGNATIMKHAACGMTAIPQYENEL